jgi:hypothetical protein
LSNSDDFLPTQENSKKISKNIKFDFLQDFDTENILNGSDRLFLTWNSRFWRSAWVHLCNALYFSIPLSLSLSLYIYIELDYCENVCISSPSAYSSNFIVIRPKFKIIILIKFFISKYWGYKNLGYFEFFKYLFWIFENQH